MSASLAPGAMDNENVYLRQFARGNAYEGQEQFNSARLLNAKQAAEYLGVTPYLLSRISVKPIPFGDGVRPTKRWDRKGLDAWLDEVSGLKEQAPVDAVPDLEEEMAEWGARYGH